MTVGTLMTFENPVFRSYAFYAGILVLKMLAMSLLTGKTRFKKKVFCSLEDIKPIKNAKLKLNDPDVERVRRAHLNDLENIPIFIVAAWLFLMTNPSASTAILLFRLFTIARIAHTFVYAVVVIPQPARALSFGVGFFITVYMVFCSLIFFIKSF